MASVPQDVEGAALGGLVGGAVTASGAGSVPSPATVVSSTLGAVTKIWNTLASRAFIQRLAEGLIGGALILIAIAHMTGAPSAVKKLAKVAVA